MKKVTIWAICYISMPILKTRKKLSKFTLTNVWIWHKLSHWPISIRAWPLKTVVVCASRLRYLGSLRHKCPLNLGVLNSLCSKAISYHKTNRQQTPEKAIYVTEKSWLKAFVLLTIIILKIYPGLNRTLETWHMAQHFCRSNFKYS